MPVRTIALAAALAASVLSTSALAEKVSIATLRFVSSGPLFVAQERGYFAQEGLDVTFRFFEAAQPIAVAVASGDAEFGVTAFTAGFYNLAGKGAIRVIGAQSKEEKGYEGSAILVSNAAYAKGFTSVEKFPGHSLAISQVGSSFHYMIGRIAERVGFKLEEVSLKPLQAVPNMVAALRSGQVDAMIIVPHIARPLVAAGEARLIGWVADYDAYQVGGLFTSAKTIRERRETVEKFVRAYRRAAQDFHDALLRKDAAGRLVEDAGAGDMLKLLNKYVYVGEDAAARIRAGVMYVDPQGRLDVGDVYRQIAWYKAHGMVDPPVDPKEILDLSFIEGHFNAPTN